MPSDEGKNHPSELQSLIANFRDAQSRGEAVDRDRLMKENSTLADSLLEFFAEYDEQKASDTSTASSINTPTLTLAGGASGVSAATSHFSTHAGGIRQFGDYELIDEIARGGMGIVFRARQIKLDRIVALKMILAGQLAGENDVQRFQTEAESAARLEHPGIVPIFEIGQHEGQHYFSMSYVEGESLGDRVAKGPLPPSEAAALVQKMSEAMAYAHGRGVIHRDLKPANVLIDESGQPRITDFGLAKKTEADSDLTGTGQILGTPAYMPPEQAGGNVAEVGPLADVYSLGAILYCLLTGRPPFQAANPMDVLRQVLDKDPLPIRQLVPTIPRDLGTICGKCLNKDPAKRYGSAEELSADLQRYLDDLPILARPAGRVERASKWASKQPVIAAILLTMAAWLLGEPKLGVGLLALIAGFHLPFRFRFFRLLLFFVVATVAAAGIGGLSYLFVWLAGESAGGTARMVAISLLSLIAPAAVVLFVFIFDCVSELPQPYRRQARMLLSVTAGISLLCIAGFFYYLRDHAEQVSGIVDQLAGEIVSLTSTSQANLDQDTSSNAMMQLVRSRTVLWMPVYTAIIWLYVALGIVLARLIRRFVYVVDGPAEIAGGRRSLQLVKAVDGDVSRWVAITAAVVVAVLPYGVGRLLSIYDIRMMRAFELGNPLVSFASVVWVIAAAWLAAFAVISRRRLLIAFAIAICLTAMLIYWTVGSVASNLDRLVADGVIPRKIVTDESLVSKFDGHTGPVKYLDIDRSGKRAASASGWPIGDGTIRLWDLESGKMLWLRRSIEERMMVVRFSSDGQKVIAGGSEGNVYVWDVETARELLRFKVARDVEALCLIDQDKNCVVAGSKVEVRDLETGKLVRELKGVKGRQLDLALSSDGKQVASGGADEMIHRWELESGEALSHIKMPAMVESLVFTENDTRLLVGLNRYTSDPNLYSISVTDPDDRKTLSGHDQTVSWVRYSPDGQYFVTASRDGTIRIWNGKTMSSVKSLKGHADWVWSAVFTPDGRNILSGGGGVATEDPGSDFSLRLWNVEPFVTPPTE